MSVASNLQELIGKTPLLKLESLSSELGVEIIGKCEFMNPTGSVKDRAAHHMISVADEAKGAEVLTPGNTVSSFGFDVAADEEINS